MAEPMTSQVVLQRVKALRRPLIIDISRICRSSPEAFLASLLDAVITGIRSTETFPDWTLGAVIDKAMEYLLPVVMRQRESILQETAGRVDFSNRPDRQAAYASFHLVNHNDDIPIVEKINHFFIGAYRLDVDYNRTVSFLVNVIDVLELAITRRRERLERQVRQIRREIEQIHRLQEQMQQHLEQQQPQLQIAGQQPQEEPEYAGLGASGGDFSDAEI